MFIRFPSSFACSLFLTFSDLNKICHLWWLPQLVHFLCLTRNCRWMFYDPVEFSVANNANSPPPPAQTQLSSKCRKTLAIFEDIPWRHNNSSNWQGPSEEEQYYIKMASARGNNPRLLELRPHTLRSHGRMPDSPRWLISSGICLAEWRGGPPGAWRKWWSAEA